MNDLGFSWLFDVAAGQDIGTTKKAVSTAVTLPGDISRISASLPAMQQSISTFERKAEDFAQAQLILQGIAAISSLAMAAYIIWGKK